MVQGSPWLKGFVALLALVCLGALNRVLLSQDGLREVGALQRAVEAQRADNAARADRNRRLAAEVRDLKQGMAALEERARADLGLIAPGEQFYQVVPPGSPAATSPPVPLPHGPADVLRAPLTRTAER
ncbi:MAG: hypothetical protein RL026_258 [Pseudomonadota bacterium]